MNIYFLLVCRCPRILRPVCGENGKEYNNECLAKCEGVQKKCDGKCPCKGSVRMKNYIIVTQTTNFNIPKGTISIGLCQSYQQEFLMLNIQ